MLQEGRDFAIVNFSTFIRRMRKAGKLISEGKFKSVHYKLRLAMQRPMLYAKYNMIYLELCNHYRKFIDEHKCAFTHTGGGGHDNVIWWCWLQGIDDCPAICKACLESLRHWYPEYKVIMLDLQNIPNYITLPNHITQKYEHGIISHAHYSDLVRLELLNNYGGAWIDSTVYVTGRKSEELLRLPLFTFREPDPNLWSIAPSWFMISDAHHPIISLTRDLMFRYWEENDSLVNYFLIYMMFKMAVKAYPDEWSRVPVVYEQNMGMLREALFDEYSEEKVRKIEEASEIHKLTYQLNTKYYNPEGLPLSPSSVYQYLIDRYTK